MNALLLAPAGLEEAAEAVRDAARDGKRVLPVGLGSKRAWTRPAAHDVELSTRALSGVLAYEPGDGTVTALAGTPWGEVERTVRAHGHHLSPSIPDADRATVGGVIAAGQSGVDRLRHGPVRHQVLGLRVLMADGAVARTGGRLVKNVTGYDLQRLHTGAHGTLGLIVEASLRLHPLPESRAIALGHAASVEEALARVRPVLAPPHDPLFVLVHDLTTEARGRVAFAVGLAGRVDVVPVQVAALRAALPGMDALTGEPGSRDAERIESMSAALRGLERASDAWPTLRTSCLPGHLPAVLAALARAARELGLEHRLLVHPGVATLDVWLRPLDADGVRALSAQLRAAGAHVHWRALPGELAAHVDPFGGAEPAGLALMRRLKAALDPTGVWASGRIAGGL